MAQPRRIGTGQGRGRGQLPAGLVRLGEALVAERGPAAAGQRADLRIARPTRPAHAPGPGQRSAPTGRPPARRGPSPSAMPSPARSRVAAILSVAREVSPSRTCRSFHRRSMKISSLRLSDPNSAPDVRRPRPYRMARRARPWPRRRTAIRPSPARRPRAACRGPYAALRRCGTAPASAPRAPMSAPCVPRVSGPRQSSRAEDHRLRKGSFVVHDVVIVGAGPVGLFLACELGLASSPCLVLER